MIQTTTTIFTQIQAQREDQVPLQRRLYCQRQQKQEKKARTRHIPPEKEDHDQLESQFCLNTKPQQFHYDDEDVPSTSPSRSHITLLILNS
jgi:hypothetical protein